MPLIDHVDVRASVRATAAECAMWTDALVIQNAPENRTGSSVTLISRSLAEGDDASLARFKGRRIVESHDHADWPYPREEAAEKEWDEATEVPYDEAVFRKLGALPGKTPNVPFDGDDDL